MRKTEYICIQYSLIAHEYRGNMGVIVILMEELQIKMHVYKSYK